MATVELTVSTPETSSDIAFQYLHINITTANEIITPQDLVNTHLPKNIDWKLGVVIEGRGPIWLYGYLVHLCHPALWVACYDSRLGAVVVATHTHAVEVGQLLTLP
jgi:CRISPR-associated protein Csx3